MKRERELGTVSGSPSKTEVYGDTYQYLFTISGRERGGVDTLQLEMASVAGVDAASVVCLCDISEGESGADGACVACCWCASPHAAMPDSSRGVLSEAVGRACCVGAGACCWFVFATCRGAYCRLVGVDRGVCVRMKVRVLCHLLRVVTVTNLGSRARLHHRPLLHTPSLYLCLASSSARVS